MPPSYLRHEAEIVAVYSSIQTTRSMLSLGFATNHVYRVCMSPRNLLSTAFSGEPAAARRRKRAETLRKRALSPLRILTMVLMLPVTTIGIAVGVYLRTSEFEREEATVHLIALAGCSAVESFVRGPFYEGQPGYHRRNDPDGDGIACGAPVPSPVQDTPPKQAEVPASRTVGNAKFLRP